MLSRDMIFCIALVFSCLGDDKFVGDKYSVLPYGTGISKVCISLCMSLIF